MRKRLTGRVASNAMDKTVVVSVERVTKDRRYGKTIKRTNRFKAHDEKNQCNVGDQVLIEETRPLSRLKCWRVVEILAPNTGGSST